MLSVLPEGHPQAKAPESSTIRAPRAEGPPKSTTRNFPLDRKKQKRAKNPDSFLAKTERDERRRAKHGASVNRRNWATSGPSPGRSVEEPITCLMNYMAVAEVKQKRRKQRLLSYSSHNSTSSQAKRASWRSSQKRLCKKCAWS